MSSSIDIKFDKVTEVLTISIRSEKESVQNDDIWDFPLQEEDKDCAPLEVDDWTEEPSSWYCSEEESGYDDWSYDAWQESWGEELSDQKQAANDRLAKFLDTDQPDIKVGQAWKLVNDLPDLGIMNYHIGSLVTIKDVSHFGVRYNPGFVYSFGYMDKTDFLKSFELVTDV